METLNNKNPRQLTQLMKLLLYPNFSQISQISLPLHPTLSGEIESPKKMKLAKFEQESVQSTEIQGVSVSKAALGNNRSP